MLVLNILIHNISPEGYIFIFCSETTCHAEGKDVHEAYLERNSDAVANLLILSQFIMALRPPENANHRLRPGIRLRAYIPRRRRLPPQRRNSVTPNYLQDD